MSEVYATRLLVRDFDRSYRFYHDLLGLSARSGAGGPPYVELFGGERFIALFDRALMANALPNGLRDGRSTDGVLLGFDVANVDREYERLRALGVAFEAPPMDRADWRLRTAHLRDPDGNLVELFHNLPAREPEAGSRP